MGAEADAVSLRLLHLPLNTRIVSIGRVQRLEAICGGRGNHVNWEEDERIEKMTGEAMTTIVGGGSQVFMGTMDFEFFLWKA
jgi:hypothetical protein